MVATDKLTRLTTLLAFLLVTLISIAVPAGVYYLGEQNQRAIIATEAEMNSILISQAIGASPDYWMYEERRLAEILARHSANEFAEKRRILDSDSSVIAQSGGEIAPPLLTVGYNLFDAGEVVGRLEIVTSLRPLLLQTIMVGIISTLLGLAIFLSLKFFPLRAINIALRSASMERERALALLNNIPDLAWLKDQDGHYVAVNGPFGRLRGIHPRDLPGKTDLDLWPRELAEKYQADDREVMASGKRKETEEEIIDSAGQSRWVSTIKCPVFNAQGDVIGTSGIGRDISERKQMEDELSESRQYLLDIIEFYPDAIMIIDTTGKVVAWNRAMEDLSGVPSATILGQGDYAYALPFYGERRPILIDLALQPEAELEGGYAHFNRHGQALTAESYIHNARGELLYFHGTATALRNSKGEVIGAIESMHDITVQQRGQEKVRQSEEKFRLLFEMSPYGIVVMDLNGRLLMCNRQAAFMHSYEHPEEMVGKMMSDLLTPESCENAAASMENLVSGETQYIVNDLSAYKRDGSIFPVEFSASLIRDIELKPSAFIAIGNDITVRKRAEDDLRANEEKLSSITNTAQDAIIMIDDEGRITFWNPAAEKIFGYSADEVLGTELHTFLAAPRYREGHEAAFPRFRATGQGLAVGKTLELAAIRKGGEEFPVELSLSAMLIKEHWHAVGIMRDISERKKYEKAAQERSELVLRLNRALVALAHDDRINSSDISVAYQTIARTSAEALSTARASIWFYTEEMNGIECMALFDSRSDTNSAGLILLAADYPIYFNEINKGECIAATDALTDPHSAEFAESYLKPLGITSLLDVPIRVSGKMIGVICHEHVGTPHQWLVEEQNFVTAMAGITAMVIEVHQRQKAEERIRIMNAELEKTVAARTNELLTVQEELVRKEKLSILGQLSGSVGHELRNPLGVMSNAVYFLKMVNSDTTTQEYLDIIKLEIDNSLRIISDLLDFARTKTPQTQVVTARQLLEESLGKCTIPESVSLKLDLPETLPRLKVDPLQMGQVFTNLVTNAVQAMTADGSLQITAQQIVSSNTKSDENFVAISIADSGEGITPENRGRLFQPLFTTKAKGIGLGLVVCKNLVEANGGRIEVASKTGQGTTFTVYLPVEPV